MTYATKAQMIDRFGTTEVERLTDRDGSAGAIVDGVLDAALARADSEINGYIATAVALPLSPVPAVVTHWAGDLARYYLHEDRMPDVVRQRYEDVIARLRDVAAGRLSLGGGAGEATDPVSPGPVLTEGPARVFSRETLKGY